MATITLDRIWLHEAADLSDTLTLRQSGWTETQTRGTEVRVYAGGRLRAITAPGASRTLSIVVPFVDRATYDQLLDRSGRLQMLRDGRGRRMWGLIDGVAGDELRSRNVLRSVSFTFTEVTVSEVV